MEHFTKNLRGDDVVETRLLVKDGVATEETLNCYSSFDLGMGTCNCVSHPTYMERPITSVEAEERGLLLGGYTVEQFFYDYFGYKMPVIVDYIKLSYQVGANPLPELRRMSNKHGIAYCKTKFVGLDLHYEPQPRETVLLVSFTEDLVNGGLKFKFSVFHGGELFFSFN